MRDLKTIFDQQIQLKWDNCLRRMIDVFQFATDVSEKYACVINF